MTEQSLNCDELLHKFAATANLLELYKRAELLEKFASSPAWQRSAGKSPQGGLNATGRASYNRATGGNLKAPVTEKNPTGKRAKRQNSFCSRMCGMKRVNTGAKAKSDPDSRINKALRKWRCKCGEEKIAALAKSIYNAPKQVRDAFFRDPELHKRLSRAGGSAPRKAKKNVQPKKLIQTNMDRQLDAVPYEEGLKLFQEGKDRIKRASDLPPAMIRGIVEGYERNKALNKSRGWGDPSIYDHTLDDRNISGILRKIDEHRKSKFERGINMLGGGLLGVMPGMLGGALVPKKVSPIIIGGLAGAAGGGAIMDKLRSRAFNKFESLSKEEKIRLLKNYLALKKKSKSSRAVKLMTEYDKLQTLTGPAVVATSLGTMAAGHVLGVGASKLPELSDENLKKLQKNLNLEGRVIVNKPTAEKSIGGRNAWFREYEPSPLDGKQPRTLGSISATGRDMWKPGIVSHELGHAHIHGSKDLTSFLQRKLYGPTMVANRMFGGLPSSLLAYGITKNDDDVSTGALKGLGAGAVSNAGVLVPEFEASRRGLMSMMKTKLPVGQKITNSLSLAPAFLTYLLSTAGVGAGVGALNAHWNKKTKAKKNRAGLAKTAKSKILQDLIEAKRLSDERDFVHKNELIKKLVIAHPKQFKVDSHLNSAYVGLTHKPTGFKIHTQKKIIPSELLTST